MHVTFYVATFLVGFMNPRAMGNSSTISLIGTSHATDDSLRNNIIITNQVSLLLGALPVIYIAINVYSQGWSRITLPILTQPFLFLLPILFNYLGMIRTSRVMVCWSMSILAIIFSVYNKTNGLDAQTSHYIGIRFSILASVVIPFLVFQLKDRLLIIISLSASLISLMAFDLIHKFFDVGYFEVGLRESGYALTNMRVMIAYLLICGGSLFLKISVERKEARNTELIHQLTEKNNEIQTQLEEITSQNEHISLQKTTLEKQYLEIVSQRDLLHQNEIKLSNALETIQTQQGVLKNENKLLEFEVLEQNRVLSENNRQLIQFNNELQQFSYTVSHNLRGPVATIMGLIAVLEQEPNGSLNSSIHNDLKKTVFRLDDIIKDLNSVLEIRNAVAHIRQRIRFREVIEKTKTIFEKEIQEFKVSFVEEYNDTRDLFSIHPFINSIVYNLMSNAIKFRSGDRRPEIKILCTEQADFFVMKFRDNGVGIDLATHNDKLFKLYKRFHLHTEGKGIGLYLVKLQAELLGGRVEVKSEINKFTEFTVYLPLVSSVPEPVPHG
jgi:signal transduction histidine kinase